MGISNEAIKLLWGRQSARQIERLPVSPTPDSLDIQLGEITVVRSNVSGVVGYDVAALRTDLSPSGALYTNIVSFPWDDTLNVGDRCLLIFQRPDVDPWIVKAEAPSGGAVTNLIAITTYLGFVTP